MPGLPTQEDLEKLPLRAIVAYAVRCARRVQPLFQRLAARRRELKEYARDVEQAISLAEGWCWERSDANASYLRMATAAQAAAARAAAAAAAADIAVAGKTTEAADEAAKAAREAVGSLALDQLAEGEDQLTEPEASAAAEATVTAQAAAALDRLAEGDAEVARAEIQAIAAEAKAQPRRLGRGRRAEDQLTEADVAAVIEAAARAQAAARADYERLLSLSDEPIDPSENGPLGPLWPNGPPEWKPVQEQPNIEVYIDPGNASKETIQAVLESLSDLHLAAGGLGLTFTVDGLWVLAGAEVRK